MMIRFSVPVLALTLLSAASLAQSPKDVEKALRTALVKKQMFLRGYSADANVNWKWDGSQFTAADPHYLALSAVMIGAVKLNGAHVLIQGDRQILVRTDGQNVQFAQSTSPVTIDVDLANADAAKVLPDLPSALFFSDLNSAIHGLPNSVTGLIPTPAKAGVASTDCDCNHASSCADYIAYNDMKGVKAAAVKSLPETPAGAAIVTVVPTVDESGKLQTVWLGRPLDPASNAAALEMAKGLSYTPSTCHDAPVSGALRLDLPVASAKGGKGKR